MKKVFIIISLWISFSLPMGSSLILASAAEQADHIRKALASEKMDQVIFHLRRQANSLLEIHEKLMEKNRNLKEEYARLKQEQEISYQKLKDLKFLLSKSQKLIAQREKHEQDLTKDIHILNREINVLEKENEERQRLDLVLGNEVESLDQKAQDLLLQRQGLEIGLQKSQQEARESELVLKEQIDLLRSEIEGFQQKNREIERKIEEQKGFLSSLGDDIDRSEQEKKKLLMEREQSENFYVQQKDFLGRVKKEKEQEKREILKEEISKREKKQNLEQDIHLLHVQIQKSDQQEQGLINAAQERFSVMEKKINKEREEAELQNLSLIHQVLSLQKEIEQVMKEKEIVQSFLNRSSIKQDLPRPRIDKTFTGSSILSFPSDSLPHFLKVPEILKEE